MGFVDLQHQIQVRMSMLDDALLGRRVLILGLARQGTALARYLAEVGAKVTVSDLRSAADLGHEMAGLSDLPIDFVLGEHPPSMLDGVDLLCLSGGVPIDAPVVKEAVRRSIPLSNDAQIFGERCPAPIVGITGSAGKTTSTALVGEMFRAAGRTTWVGGNIGNPLIADLDQISPDHWVVIELSSFQLEVMSVSPHIAAVLNITPNHLDRHKTMDSYIAAKKSIVAFQGRQDYAVLGYDDENARELAHETDARIVFFSGASELDEGACCIGDDLVLRLDGAESVICRADQVSLRGFHNVLNALASCAIAGLAGLPLEAMRAAVTTFTAVEHRLELVKEHKGVAYYNDSIATAPERVVAAMRSFEEPIVLLAGGRDKDLPWGGFAAEVVGRVSRLVTFGEAGEMIARVVSDRLTSEPAAVLKEIVTVDSLQEAVKVAAGLARPGDIVLLSPGGTSFDAYRDFAARGAHFKELVGALEG